MFAGLVLQNRVSNILHSSEEEPPSLEVQHAIRVFSSIPHVFELRGTKRFEIGDPTIPFLTTMRTGGHFAPKIWKAFTATFAREKEGSSDADPRHEEENFRSGYGLAMYWETLSRWISRRAREDSLRLGVPCVFLQAVDECNAIDWTSARRLLNVPNLHNTGHIHGVLPAHVGMEVRFTMKLNSAVGLVQEQRATIVVFVASCGRSSWI